MATASDALTEDRGELAVLRRVLEKNAGMVGAALANGGKVLRRGVSRLAPAAATGLPRVPPVAAGGGFRAGLSEFKAGLRTGRRLGIGPAEAAKAAPSLWKSVGHNMADQAVQGAVLGTVAGGALGAYQAPRGEGLSGAVAGAGEGLKAGIVGGALAGAAGGALRHGRYKALTHTGSTPAQAQAVMRKSPLQNVKDAWANKGNPGSWQADALEAAAVPATIYAENMAQGLGEKKQDKVASAEPKASKKRRTRAAVHLSHAEEMQLITAAKAILRAVRDSRVPKIADMPRVVVVPMMGAHKTPAELEAEKRDRAAYETDKAVGKAAGPLAGAVGAEALLRSTLDPLVAKAPAGSVLSHLTPDSVPRKILLPGLGAALGAYGAHRMIQARREDRERASQAALVQDAAQAALAQVPTPPHP